MAFRAFRPATAVEKILLALATAALVVWLFYDPLQGMEPPPEDFEPDQSIETVHFMWVRGLIDGDTYQEKLKTLDLELARNVILLSPEKSTLTWRYGLSERWDFAFTEILGRRVAWIAELRASPDRMWQEVLRYMETSGLTFPYRADEWIDEESLTSGIAFHLFHLAMDLDNPQALYARAMSYRAEIPGEIPIRSKIGFAFREDLLDAAEAGHEEALHMLIRGHIEGGDFPKDPSRAWYWISRARAQGMDVDRWAAAVSSQLTLEERQAAEALEEPPHPHHARYFKD